MDHLRSCIVGLARHQRRREEAMPEVRELRCKTHGDKCDGNIRHAHVFVWVKR
ncbi:hypothetical protein HOS59_gp50 [Streptomyces phage Rowa]|uniref:Uncharacterized protein n=1 Tax=Streptomyces phage Rowa TaxID=2059883 RepID=A0A2H5BLZ8_9CAUD|nr:hypothetical protein HOS59_gp50 [Streptomyces phage Rowa]AUG87314.1 hypothetical protein SEA_ROWA_50 [Streptomyces phage Rowa]